MLHALSTYLQRKDQAVREDGWEKTDGPWEAAREEIDAIYDQMIALRHQIAVNAGRKDYRDYAFAELERFDYTPSDCEQFADTIQQVIVPLSRKLGESRKEQLGLDRLRPWDTAVDPLGREPLTPFSGAKTL